MKPLKHYLLLCKQNLGIETDAELAKALGIKRSSMSTLMNGGGASNETMLKIAELSKTDDETIWLTVMHNRQGNNKLSRYMKSIIKSIAERSGFES